jgi:hypothetical protein
VRERGREKREWARKRERGREREREGWGREREREKERERERVQYIISTFVNVAAASRGLRSGTTTFKSQHLLALIYAHLSLSRLILNRLVRV